MNEGVNGDYLLKEVCLNLTYRLASLCQIVTFVIINKGHLNTNLCLIDKRRNWRLTKIILACQGRAAVTNIVLSKSIREQFPLPRKGELLCLRNNGYLRNNGL